MKLFNTLTKKKEEFIPLTQNTVSLYSCGPTVYNFVHIGNLRAYVAVDFLKRYLKYQGYNINHVMNITDIDDKTILHAQKNNSSLQEYTEKYTNYFFEDLEKLHISIPTQITKALNYIPSIISSIEKLLANEHAYIKNNSVYFRIHTSKEYGAIANLNQRTCLHNADQRLSDDDEYDKESVSDFVLWKGYKEEDGDVFWEAPFGKGRPGWHIECSVMSLDALGDTFDIHTGGIDLLFPHHTNEIAQSEALTEKQPAQLWFHNEHLLVNGKKMSKSLNNFYTLSDLLIKGYHFSEIRYVLLSTHYRQEVDFSFEKLKHARDFIMKILWLLSDLDTIKLNKSQDSFDAVSYISDCKLSFKDALDDDLNISKAIASFSLFIQNIQKNITSISQQDASLIKEFIFDLDTIFGIFKSSYDEYIIKKDSLLQELDIQNAIKERNIYKSQKNYQESDAIRDKLLIKYISLKDMPNGDSIVYISQL
jgi:cysteinyl-tRNA synthetase